jgi:hypothetical protein
MIGIICFLIVVVLANILTFYVLNQVFQSLVTFINVHFWLLLLIAIIFFVADIFGAFPFPLNVPAPLINAIGIVFCIAFILRVFQWVDSVMFTNLYQTFWLISFLIVPLVFIIVLTGGYFTILRQVWWKPKEEKEIDGRVLYPEQDPDRAKIVSDAKSWEEIGAEFRLMLFDIIHRLRQEVNKNK